MLWIIGPKLRALQIEIFAPRQNAWKSSIAMVMNCEKNKCFAKLKANWQICQFPFMNIVTGCWVHSKEIHISITWATIQMSTDEYFISWWSLLSKTPREIKRAYWREAYFHQNSCFLTMCLIATTPLSEWVGNGLDRQCNCCSEIAMTLPVAGLLKPSGGWVGVKGCRQAYQTLLRYSKWKDNPLKMRSDIHLKKNPLLW